MKVNYKNILLILAFVPLVLSCNDFLSEKPSKTTSLVPETVDHLETLLNGYSSFYQEGNRAVVFGSDDYGLYKELYQAKSSAYGIVAVEFATWDIQYLPDDTRESFWANEYKKIFIANMVLDYLPKVSGDADTKLKLKAEAHFIKAYSYFVLANTYCLPYTAVNKNEMGLVLKNSVSFDEPLPRATLEATYQEIESNLKEAQKLSVGMTMANNKYRSWRASKPAVDAFAARYYLNLNNYTEALKYADEALKGHDVMMDYNTDMRYSSKVQTVTINSGLPTQEVVEIKYPYTHDNQSDMTDMMEWKEFYYFRMLYNEGWWYIPSSELLNLYDHEYDLRYKYHMVKNYSYDRGLTKPAYEYPGYVFFYKDRLPSGPTVAEMLLIKAECQARQGSYAEAMNTVNILRAKRISNEAPANVINLTASSKEEAITKVLQERRRELPFTQRWFDIRRFNNNDDSSDDVVLTREFYPYTNSGIMGKEPLKNYTLEKNSRRYAAPIHYTEIQSSLGAIKQNVY